MSDSDPVTRTDGRESGEVSHESYLDCPLPDTAEKGEKQSCECGRVWRFDGQYFIMEGIGHAE